MRERKELLLFVTSGFLLLAGGVAWLADAVTDPQGRNERLTRWAQAPSARASHPREEHLLPLMVAAGAAEGERGVRTYADRVLGKAISGFQFG